jgi:hypothetical protein
VWNEETKACEVRERLVVNNQELQAELRAIRLSLPFRNQKEYYSWIQQAFERAIERAKKENIFGQIRTPELDNLNKMIDDLAMKHGAIKWRSEISNLIVLGDAHPVFSLGLPGFKSISNPDGTVKLGPDGSPEFEIVIPPDFDASNPLARERLKEHKRLATPPPKPQPIKNN